MVTDMMAALQEKTSLVHCDRACGMLVKHMARPRTLALGITGLNAIAISVVI